MGRSFALLPALLFAALFGSEHALVGGSQLGVCLHTLGWNGVNPDDVGNGPYYGRKAVGSHFPTSANSRRQRHSPGKVRDNDTYPGMGINSWDEVGMNLDLWPPNAGVSFVGNPYRQVHGALVYLFTFDRPASTPSCSPFSFLVIFQMHLDVMIAWLSKRSCSLHKNSFLLLLTSTAVVPLCAVSSDRYLRTRLLYPLQQVTSLTWRTVAVVMTRVSIHLHRRHSRGWIFDPGGVKACPRTPGCPRDPSLVPLY